MRIGSGRYIRGSGTSERSLVEGGEVTEYSAHVIPEAGVAMMPKMTTDGMLVAGDAAALCLAAGIWLEGVNFAMASGIYAGEAALEALRAGDVSAAGLAGYRRRLESTFVLRDHRKLRLRALRAEYNLKQ